MQFRRTSRMALWLFLALIAVTRLAAQEILIVSPSELADQEGDNNVNPNLPAFRFQQIFPASDFESLPESHHKLVRITSRPDAAVAGPAVVEWDDLQFKLSITSIDPEDISDFYDENIEQEQTLVYDGSVTMTTENTGPPEGPRDFDQHINLQVPFVYDPSQGNLLLEYVTTTGFTSDAPSDFFDFPVTSVYTTDPVAEVGTLLGGVVYQFTFVSSSPVLQAGDADQDFDFDQLDLVQVQIAAKYLTGQAATWGEGDWNGAPGGSPGNPPVGDGQFNQLDIIAALGADIYLKGPYATLTTGGAEGDGQTSLVYDAATGELSVDAPTGTNLTSMNVTSAASRFVGEKPTVLDGAFDNFAGDNIFKATFGGSFGSISFGNVLPIGLTEEDVSSDLSAVGSLAGGGDLGEVDLVYVPEPSAIVLLGLGWLAALIVNSRHRRVAK